MGPGSRSAEAPKKGGTLEVKGMALQKKEEKKVAHLTFPNAAPRRPEPCSSFTTKQQKKSRLVVRDTIEDYYNGIDREQQRKSQKVQRWVKG